MRSVWTTGGVLCLLVALAAVPVSAEGSITVGIVIDGPSERLDTVLERIEEETLLLAERQFSVSFPMAKRLDGGWTASGIRAAFQRLHADADVDVVIALGLGSANVAVQFERHPKPTIAAFLFSDPKAASRQSIGSETENLTYLTLQGDLEAEIETFLRVVRFERLALLTDSIVLETNPALRIATEEVAKSLEIEILLAVQESRGEDLGDPHPGDRRRGHGRRPSSRQ